MTLRYVVVGQASFAFFLAVCVALHPGFVLKANEGGLSNYGVHAKTVVFFTLALALPGFLSLMAARHVTRGSNEDRLLRRVLTTYGLLALLTLATTYGYTENTLAKDLHIVVGVLITVFEFVATIAMCRRVRTMKVVPVVATIGIVLAALTFVGVLHVLFLTQMVVGTAFAFAVIRFTDVAMTP